jgi:hypothetical protein
MKTIKTLLTVRDLNCEADREPYVIILTLYYFILLLISFLPFWYIIICGHYFVKKSFDKRSCKFFQYKPLVKRLKTQVVSVFTNTAVLR